MPSHRLLPPPSDQTEERARFECMRLVRVGAISDADCCGYETKRCRGAAFSIGYTNGGADNAVRAREALFPHHFVVANGQQLSK